jgi:putative inorganic carbon (hco3(-)) transporter
VVFTMTLPIALAWLEPPFGVARKLAGLAAAGTLLLATYYTGSRGGFLATIVLVGLYVLLRLRISFTRMMVAAGVVLVAFALAPAHLTSTRDSHGSAQHRVDMWGQGIEMVQQNPLFGIGRGNFAGYSGSLIAHNSSIEIMGETGLPGMFFWLGLIYLAFKNLVLAYRTPGDEAFRPYVRATSLAIAGYLLSSMFVTLEYETFYLLLALAAAIGKTLEPAPKIERRDMMLVGAGIVAIFVAVKGTVLVYY